MILGATFYLMEGNENKEQPITKRDYLPDGIVALENAQQIAVAQSQNAIKASSIHIIGCSRNTQCFFINIAFPSQFF